jgi:hypothetical protein
MSQYNSLQKHHYSPLKEYLAGYPIRLNNNHREHSKGITFRGNYQWREDNSC